MKTFLWAFVCETVFVLDHGEKLAEGPPGVIQSE
jgi:ABC-type branched-subunit amino acid transport system ATPase component